MKRSIFIAAQICIVAVLVPTFLTQASLAQGLKLDTQKTTDEGEGVTVKINDGVAKIDQENTRIEFVGTHVGDDPKPRLGGFKKFSGKITVDEQSNELKSINVTIEIGSIWTEFGNLTNHLKAADFFDAAKFKEAKFESEKIEKEAEGKYNVTGKLSMIGVSADLTFPVTVQIEDDSLKLQSSFDFDRTEYGMTKMTEGVEKAVSIKVAVGKKTLGEREKK
jgi:polyisoprenoid-binding protein YceI